MKSPKFLPKPRRLKPFMLRRIAGESMLPTLAPGRIVLAINPRRIKPGDIIFLRHKGLEKVKRVKYIQGDKVFVIGDNPPKSTDSRSFGLITRNSILAKVAWPAT